MGSAQEGEDGKMAAMAEWRMHSTTQVSLQDCRVKCARNKGRATIRSHVCELPGHIESATETIRVMGKGESVELISNE